MPWTIASQPELDPAALAAFKDQVRVLGGSFDDELSRCLSEAIDVIQEITHRQLITATAVLTLDKFPWAGARLYLPPSPLASVTSITYTDTDGATQTWNSSNYEVVTNTEPGYVRPIYNGDYPTDARGIRENVVVTYVVGYGANWATVAARVQRAVILKAQQLYEPDRFSGIINNVDIDRLVDNAITACLVGDELCA